jgi:hypothetical protein
MTLVGIILGVVAVALIVFVGWGLYKLNAGHEP